MRILFVCSSITLLPFFFQKIENLGFMGFTLKNPRFRFCRQKNIKTSGIAGASPQKFERGGQRREVRRVREPVRGLAGPTP